jgi:lipopolysaccharide heptosyltransferase II
LSPVGAESILIILPNNLGDVIMATPVLSGLKKRYPQSRISFLVESGNEAGIINNPECDEILAFPRKKIRAELNQAGGINGVSQLREELQALGTPRYDQVMNLSQIPYISFLVTLFNADAKTGQHFLPQGNHAIEDAWSLYLYAIPFARHYNRLHASDIYRRIADVQDHSGYSINIDAHEMELARQFLISQGVDPSNPKTAVFQPGASVPAKRWPTEHFVQLGRLMADSGWQILVSGAPSERELAEAIAASIGSKATSTAGETTFRQAIANLCFARVCVTGDTALMHAAAALRVPVFALFGPTSPVETGPYGDGNWVFSGKCAERPCFCSSCKSLLCMKSVTPSVVFGCIAHGFADDGHGCDVFRTMLEPNGDFRLVPQKHTLMPYYSETGAELTRMAFEGRSNVLTECEDYQQQREETYAFIAGVLQMHQTLLSFVDTSESSYVTMFERHKQSLAEFGGIGAFWTAVLNLRLNSVPVLNPLTAVADSAMICLQTAEQLKRLLEK